MCRLAIALFNATNVQRNKLKYTFQYVKQKYVYFSIYAKNYTKVYKYYK